MRQLHTNTTMTTTQIALLNLASYLQYSKLGYEAEFGGLVELLTGACDSSDEEISQELAAWKRLLNAAQEKLEEGPDDSTERWEIELRLLRNAAMALNAIN